MGTKRFYCSNKGCFFSSSTSFGLSKHVCRVSSAEKRLKLDQPLLRAPEPSVDSASEQTPGDVPHDNLTIEDNSSVDTARVQLLKFCSVLQECTDNRSKEVMKALHSIILHESFDINLFRSELPHISSCYKLARSEFENLVLQDGFHKRTIIFHEGQDIHSAVLFHKDILACLRKQLSLSSDEDIVFPDGDNYIQHSPRKSHPMHTDYFCSKHKELKQRIMGCSDENIIWYNDDNNFSFIGFIQIFTDKTVAAQKSNSFAAHAVHATFVNFSKAFRNKMIQTGQTLVGFLPVGLDECDMDTNNNDDQNQRNSQYKLFTEIETEEYNSNSEQLHSEPNTNIVPLSDTLHLTTQTKGRHIKLEIIFRSMKVILHPLLEVSRTGLLLKRNPRLNWYCYPHLVSYCCDIPEAKDMSAIRHNLVTCRPCHRCLVTLTGMRTGKEAPARTFRVTNWIRRMNKASGDVLKDHLKAFSIAPWKSFLEELQIEYPSFIPNSLYDIFTFEPLHNLHLGISKLLKNCTFNLISSNYPAMFSTNKNAKPSVIRSKKTSILSGCNTLLRAIERDSGVSGLHVDFSGKDASSRLNGIFLQTGLRGMLEGKDYRRLDTVFPFVAAFIDTVAGSETGQLTKVHMLYTELLLQLEKIDKSDGINDEIISTLSKKVNTFKQLTQTVFEPYVENGLFTLKFHMLHHLVEDVKRYTSLEYLSASPYEYYNTRIKQNYRKTSKRHATVMEETVSRISEEINQFSDAQCCGPAQRQGHSNQILVSDGFKVSLRELKAYASSGNSTLYTDLHKEIQDNIPFSDLPVLISLVEDEVTNIMTSVLDYDITLTFVKSGFIEPFPTPTMEDYNEDSNIVRYKESPRKACTRRRVFATNSFGSSKAPMHTNIFLKGRDEGKDQFWFARTLLLFHIHCSKTSFHKEVTFVRYYETTRPESVTEKLLNCICLKWEADTSSVNQHTLSASESYGIVPFQSVCGGIHIVRSNYAIKPFSSELPWTEHRFQVNRFYK